MVGLLIIRSTLRLAMVLGAGGHWSMRVWWRQCLRWCRSIPSCRFIDNLKHGNHWSRRVRWRQCLWSCLQDTPWRSPSFQENHWQNCFRGLERISTKKRWITKEIHTNSLSSPRKFMWNWRWFADLVENVEGKVFDIRSNFCILVFQPISSSVVNVKKNFTWVSAKVNALAYSSCSWGKC